jgi:hypothetical protein
MTLITAVAAYYGVDHDTSLSAGAVERTLAAKMKMLRQQLRDALLMQAKASFALMHALERGEQSARAADVESGGGGASAIPSFSPAASVKMAFITCGTSLRRCY